MKKKKREKEKKKKRTDGRREKRRSDKERRSEKQSRLLGETVLEMSLTFAHLCASVWYVQAESKRREEKREAKRIQGNKERTEERDRKN